MAYINFPIELLKKIEPLLKEYFSYERSMLHLEFEKIHNVYIQKGKYSKELEETYLSVPSFKQDYFETSLNTEKMYETMMQVGKAIMLDFGDYDFNKILQMYFDFVDEETVTETDWDKIQNHICVLSFLQGLPIGSKYYNDYVILTNDKNEEYISKDAIYITTQEPGSSNIEYHQPGCSRLIEDDDTDSMRVIPPEQFREAYYNIDFLRQTVRISEGNYIYFYPQAKYNAELNRNNTCTACYNCIVNSSNTYDIEDIIDGIIEDPKSEDGVPIYDASDSNTKNDKFREVRSMYYSALARERYYLYKSNDYLDAN